MKKLTATAILMVVISVLAFRSVMSHIETITGWTPWTLKEEVVV